MNKFSIKHITLYLFILLLAASTVDASKGAVVLLKGKLTDSDNGSAVVAPIFFVPNEGRQVKSKSNSINGEFQQVMPSGFTYTIYVKGYQIVDATPIYDIPKHTEYKEYTRDLKLKKFSEGQKFIEVKIFEPNESIITASGAEHLRTLKSFLTINKQLKIVVTVSSYDSWLKNKTVKVKKKNSRGKTYTKKVRLKTKARLQNLLTSRISALQAFFKENRIFVKNDIYREDLKIVSEKKKRKRRKNPKTKRKEWYLPEMPNVCIRIGKILKR
ncbi:MAG: hypothetical protein PF588_00330 [Candidatus Kapabacteria bacterium]|jgi:hypothetical protein|nr:hypothetical protein [Candidatus Kapabacteria bacterium]